MNTLRILAIALMAPLLFAQGSNQVSLLSQLSYPLGSCADVWADGDLVAIARRSEGFDLIDTSNPSSPMTVYSGRTDLFIQDLKIEGNLLICSNESGNGQAVVIFDISTPSNPVELGSFGGLSIFACNNLWVFQNHVYAASLTGNSLVVIDISSPSTPSLVTTLQPQFPISLIHDVAVVNAKLYLSWLSGGFDIYDLANPAAPVFELTFRTPTSLFHNTWPLDDGIHVATTDEVSGGYLQIWNISNPSNVTLASQWRASPAAVMHNLFIRGDLAFLTNYTEGLRIVDLSNPLQPAEVGYYDTFNGVNPFQFGAWGVYPSAERVYVADFNTGLYTLDFTPVAANFSANMSSYSGGQTVMLSLGADSTGLAAPLDMAVSLSISAPTVSSQSLTLLSFSLVMPAGAAGSIPYNIGLPPAPLGGPIPVELSLTLSNLNGSFIFDRETIPITLN